MRLITFIAATLGAIGHCEGAAVPDGDSAPVLATRYPSDCKLTNACLRSLFDEPLKAEYICKKLLHRPQIVKTTKYIPVLTTKTFTLTKYSVSTKTIYKPVTKYLYPIVNKRHADAEPPPTTAELPPSETPDTGVSESTDLPVTAKAIAVDPEPALIPDEAIFAGRDPSFRPCITIDQLKTACGCFLDFKRVPKIVIKTVTQTKYIVKKKFVDTTVVKVETKTIAQPLLVKNAANCFRRYKPTQPISGIDTRPFVVRNIRNAWDCCQLCAKTNNCIAASYGPATYFDLYLNGSPFGAQPATSTTCTYLVQTQKLLGAATTDNCPLGSRNIEFGPVNGYGSVFAGPCGY